MPSLGFISWRYWRSQPAKAFSCLLAVALALALTLATDLVVRSLQQGEEALVEDTLGYGDLQVVATAAEGVPATWQGPFADVAGVVGLEPVLLREGVALGEREKLLVQVRGLTSGNLPYAARLRQGRFFGPREEDAVLVSDRLAARLALSPGDLLALSTPLGFQRYRVVGVYEAASQSASALGVLAPLERVQTDFAGSEPLVSWFEVALAPGYERSAVQAELQDQVGRVARVETLSERRAAFRQTFGGAALALVALAILALLAAVYLLVSNLSLMLVERAQDFTHLSRLGLSQASLLRWLSTELLAFILLGSLLGALLGWALAVMLVRLTGDSLLVPSPLSLAGLEASWRSLLWAASALGLLSFAAIGYLRRRLTLPGSTAMGLEPLVLPALTLALLALAGAPVLPALQASERLQLLWRLGFSALLLLAASLAAPILSRWLARRVASWAGAPAWLWLASKLRGRRAQGSVAVASLMVSLAILTGVFGVVHSYRASLSSWLEQMFDWDLIVSQQSLGLHAEVPISGEVGWELAVVPGVSLVSGDTLPIIKQDRLRANLYVFDMRSFPQRRSFESLAGVSGERLPEVLASGRSVAISRSLANANDLSVGDGLSLVTPTGEYPYDVKAIVEDAGAAARAVFMDRQIYLRDWRDENVDLFTVAVEPGADREAVAALIRAQLSSRYPIEVRSAEAYQDEMERLIGRTFAFSQVLALLFVAIAAWGLLNVALGSVATIRREVSLLTILGAEPKLLRQVLLFDLFLHGGFGVLAGLTLGTLLSRVLVPMVQLSSRFTVTWHLPVTAYPVLVGAVALVVMFVGALTLRSVRRPA